MSKITSKKSFDFGIGNIKRRSRGSVILSPHNVVHLHPKNKKEICDLVTPHTYELFGNIDIVEILNLCYLSYGVYNDEYLNLVGVLMGDCFPNIPAISPWDWQEWFTKMYGYKGANARNTLWIHALLWHPNYELFFLKPILQYIFTRRVFITYIILVVPSGIKASSLKFIEKMGTLIRPKIHTYRLEQCVCVFKRQNFVKSYKIRKALEEDNDDLVPLIQTYCPQLNDIYGDYYIAEILQKQNLFKREILVAENEGNVVALLVINRNVNYEILNKEFDLVPFNGLKKPHFRDLVDYRMDASLTDTPQDADYIKDSIASIRMLDISYSSGEEDESSDSSEYSVVLNTSLLFFEDEDEEDSNSTTRLLDDISSSTKIKINESKDASLTDTHSSFVLEVTRSNSFFGEPNAFAVEILATHPDHDLCFLELFEAAFQCFSGTDYMVISTPTFASPPIARHYFCHPVRTFCGEFPHEFYLMHRTSIFGVTETRELTYFDLREVKSLLRSIPCSHEVYEVLEESLREKNPFDSYIFTCCNEIVGIAVVCPEPNSCYLNNCYTIETYENMQYHKFERQGSIEYFILSPAFERHVNAFLRDLHRLSQFSIFFHKLFPNKTTLYCNCLNKMTHVMPKVRPEYDLKLLQQEGYLPSKSVTEVQPAFALFFTTPLMRSFPYTIINAKIVIVGLSCVTLGFLKSLIYKQSYDNFARFTNVTVITSSTNDLLEGMAKLDDAFLIKKYMIDKRYLDQLSLRTYVNFVDNKLFKIDRKNKMVTLDDNRVITYDLLFLLSGDVFHKPIGRKGTQMPVKPDNIFVIQSLYDMYMSFAKLKQLRQKLGLTGSIIVYGYYLQSLVMLSMLRYFEVPGSRICFVENFPKFPPYTSTYTHNFNMFNDPHIDECIRKKIVEEGIKVYSSCYFNDWTFLSSKNIVTSVHFESRHRIVDIECMCMFYFGTKGVSTGFSSVLRRAGIVYDGSIIINNNFETNDPFIYAAGSATKYSRKYCAFHMSHKYFNRMEIGECLGTKIRTMLTSCLPENNSMLDYQLALKKSKYLVPVFHKPLMRYCKLPGNLYYLSIMKPGQPVPLESALNKPDYGRILVTGDCRLLDSQGYFRIHINDNRRIETITCLSKDPINYQNLYQIWGKHEQILNNLEMRFDMLLIPDFYDYFREAWAYAIYHDKFNEILEELNVMLMSSSVPDGSSFLDKILTKYKEAKWEKLPIEADKEIKKCFDGLPFTHSVEKKIMKFIKSHANELPMYALPSYYIMTNIANDPLFTTMM